MGTGDWNDGMNRVGAEGQGRERLELLVPDRHPPRLRRGRRVPGRLGAGRDLPRPRRGPPGRRSRRTPGTASGIAGPTSTTGRRSARRPTTNARSTRSPSPGPRSPGVADPDRAGQAMESVDERLVHDEDGVILLFTPPFDKGKLQPGYIKGYVPGVRENGGQYTHAATWLVLAAAIQGRGQRAFELFDLLNPVKHATDPESVARYKVEPYVVAADIYGRPPHTGRGGWTWYTGSASWLFRVGLEAILGFHLQGRSPGDRPQDPRRLAGLRDRLSPPVEPLPDRGREPRRRRARRPVRHARRPGRRPVRDPAGRRRAASTRSIVRMGVERQRVEVCQHFVSIGVDSTRSASIRSFHPRISSARIPRLVDRSGGRCCSPRTRPRAESDAMPGWAGASASKTDRGCSGSCNAGPSLFPGQPAARRPGPGPAEQPRPDPAGRALEHLRDRHGPDRRRPWPRPRLIG